MVCQLEKRNNIGALKAFFYSGMISAIIFIPFILLGSGIFSYMGDFNAQQIPFYTHCHEMVRNGFNLWDFSTEFGNNFFASYTYYTLCSPFFWLTVPFPTAWVPYLMGPLFIFKFACAGLTSYLYIRYFTKTEKAALYGSVLYSFCGWSVFNIFYNQFHESFIVFPLLLLSLEKLVNDNKRGWFALCCAAAAITNFYFFVGMAVFTAIYWAVKSISKAWEMNLKQFGKIALEAVLGALSAMFVLLPSAYAIFGMSRVGDYISGWNFWFYADPKIYFYIIQSMLFPAEIPAIQSFGDVKGIAWQSLSLYLPLIGCIGVLAFVKQNKRSWQSRLLITSFIMAMVPGFNALFTLCQNVYYARWFMMPILIMCLVTAISIENNKPADFAGSYKRVAVATVLIIAIIALTPVCTDGVWKIGIWNRNDGGRLPIFAFFSFVAILQLLLIFLYGKKSENILKNKYLFKATAGIIVMVAMFTLLYGRASGGNGVFVNDCIAFKKYAVQNLDTKDCGRVSLLISDFNLSTVSGINSPEFFHSVAPEGTIGVYKSLLGFDRDVRSPETTGNPYYKAITSVKYLMVEQNRVDHYDSLTSGETENLIENVPELFAKYGYPLMPGYTLDNQGFGQYRCYKNDNYLSMGISYQYYIKQSDYDKLNKSQQGRAMLNAVVIPDTEENKYKSFLTNYSRNNMNKDYTNNEFTLDCQNKETCSNYKELHNGFQATKESKGEELVMFSVSTDKNGWTAFVNGKQIDIYIVDGGFMAVKLGKGQNTIEFKYQTPGLRTGMLASAVGFLGIGLLFALSKRKK